jgi:hypothetical protein
MRFLVRVVADEGYEYKSHLVGVTSTWNDVLRKVMHSIEDDYQKGFTVVEPEWDKLTFIIKQVDDALWGLGLNQLLGDQPEESETD